MNFFLQGAFLQLAIVLLSNKCNAAGGIAGLKELTDDMPYFGSGNRWDYFPQIADGGARTFSAFYSDYGAYYPYQRYGGYRGYGGYGGYGSGLYGNYGGGFSRGIFARSPATAIPVNSRVSSTEGRFYTGRGNAFVNHK
uniref:Uncharacterized protein n=1 Tax=Parascaris univalens TaxID=6257 RepID=A0A915AU21_PARUN